MQEIRVVDKKDRHGNPLVIGFAQFETVHQAAATLKTLQVSKQSQSISGSTCGDDQMETTLPPPPPPPVCNG